MKASIVHLKVPLFTSKGHVLVDSGCHHGKI